MTQLCDICGEGHTQRVSIDIEQKYNNHRCKVATAVQICDHCGAEFTGPEENRLNKRAMMTFRKRVDGLLTGEQIKDIRLKYGITQHQAGKLLGGGPVAFCKYEKDDIAHSDAMDNLLRLIRRSAFVFWELVDEKDMRGEIKPVSEGSALKSYGSVKSETMTLEVASNSSTALKDAIYDPRKFRNVEVDKVSEWKR